MADPPLLSLQGIALTFGGTPLLTDAGFILPAGGRMALVGRNGSGKSTLLRIAAGEVEADRGERFVAPRATLRYLPQEPDLSGFASTLAYVEAGLAPGDDPHRARLLLEGLGLSGEEAPGRLSGGEARRAALARTLAPRPDILLLDEPTNHLDLPAIEWLEAELARLRSAVILISHDRRLLADLTRTTVWLDRGVTRTIDRGFGAFEEWRDAFLAEEEAVRHKLDRKIVAEEHWVRYGVTARRKRNVRRLSELADLRRTRREARRTAGVVRIAVSEAGSSGALVAVAEGIAKAFDGRPVVRDFTTTIVRGDRVAIVGPNGAGKTTLLKLLTGALPPDAGTVKLGANLEIAALDQGRAALAPETPLRDALAGKGRDTVILNGAPKHVIGYLQDFLFTPDQALTPVGRLSGGERARVMLARALALPSNLLVLDEPTNDLDLETLDLLEETVGNYPGTVIVVSHDRDFIDRVATQVIMAEGGGSWTEYAGGYSDMVAQRGAGVVAATRAEPARPSRPSPRVSASSGPARRKLSFNEQRALNTLPAEIEALRKEKEALEAALADPRLYARDPAGFARRTVALAAATTSLGEAEERWLALEILREELESG